MWRRTRAPGLDRLYLDESEHRQECLCYIASLFPHRTLTRARDSGPTIRAMVSRRRVIAVFVAVMCVPAATVLWLAGRLVQQDRQLEAHYKQERRDQAADRVVKSLQAALSEPALFRSEERR